MERLKRAPGRQLFVEEEARVAARQTPYRTMCDLSLTERWQLAADARVFGVDWTVHQYHVSPLTVRAVLNSGRA